MVHEEIHAHQQCSFDGGAERLWSLYLTNASFRLDQESQAFRAQYAFVKKEISDSKQLARLAHVMSTDLSSPTYVELSPSDKPSGGLLSIECSPAEGADNPKAFHQVALFEDTTRLPVLHPSWQGTRCRFTGARSKKRLLDVAIASGRATNIR